jgi:membrane associated rhomboid family serine protease
MIPLRDDNPTRIIPFLTIAIMVANVLVFFYQLSLPPRLSELLVYQYGVIPAVVFGSVQLPPQLEAIPPIFSLITSMFLHGGWMHLIGNMWYLWLFGNNIEEAMGRLRYVLFYLITGLAAALFHAFTNSGSEVPTIGASGAISGILGAYLMLYTRAQVLVLIPLGFFTRLMYIPAAFVLGFWFVLQLMSGGIGSTQGGGVAWWAHVGGFVAGMILCVVFKRRDVPLLSGPREHPRFLS